MLLGGATWCIISPDFHQTDMGNKIANWATTGNKYKVQKWGLGNKRERKCVLETQQNRHNKQKKVNYFSNTNSWKISLNKKKSLLTSPLTWPFVNWSPKTLCCLSATRKEVLLQRLEVLHGTSENGVATRRCQHTEFPKPHDGGMRVQIPAAWSESSLRLGAQKGIDTGQLAELPDTSGYRDSDRFIGNQHYFRPSCTMDTVA